MAELALSVAGVDGIVVANTTSSRPATLTSAQQQEAGGLSGEPLKGLALKTLKDLFVLTRGKVPLVGVGGISSGEDAYLRIRAGASLVQVYTAFSLQGPGLVRSIHDDLEALLKRDGFATVAEAVGVDTPLPPLLTTTTRQPPEPEPKSPPRGWISFLAR
jgi:dihydroorotate dehydrogenase